ncbi:hypothetical protein C8J57DRAFT_1365513 [Mycena rebaudengoi]|nr:hypothetical protein C8J57DRAFT_1365513 [Mycena rebaudengoi]
MEQPIADTASAKPPRNRKRPAKTKPNPTEAGSSNPSSTNQPSSAKLRGLSKDSPEVRVSKTLSWILRHGAKSEGLPMRPDGFVKVTDLIANPRLNTLSLDALKEIVKADKKQRYDLILSRMRQGVGIWWMIETNSCPIKSVQLELRPILSVSDIPGGIAVHGTTKQAWESICPRASSQVFIFVDVQRAIDAGIKFFLSDNGVVLTAGDERGFLAPQFFERVEGSKRVTISPADGNSLVDTLNVVELI